MTIIAITDDVPGAAASPAEESLLAGSKHPLHITALSLVGGGGPGPLVVHRRLLNIPLLILLLDPSSASPPHADSVPSVPLWRQG